MQLEKIIANGLSPRLKRHFGNISGSEVRAETVNFAQSLGIRDGLDIKNQYRGHGREALSL
jgi:hypothetical protein